MGGRTSRLAGIAFDANQARHHVLRDAHPGIAIDHDGGELVHAGAVIADVTFDLDRDRGGQTAGNGVRALGLENLPVPRRGIRVQLVQRLVELPHGGLGQIDLPAVVAHFGTLQS